MNGLVPTFGIDGYAERVAWLLTAAPREMALVEAGCLGALGAGAAVLLLLAVVRRSALSAVGFSFVALSALIVAILFGRLDFLSEGVQVLIVCLHACSVLLFLTATVRMARDNAVVGLLSLLLIGAFVAVGIAAILGVIDGWPFAQLAVVITLALTVLLVMAEVLRGDRGTIIVAPGLLLAAASLPAMAFVAGQGAGEDWLFGSAPLLLLTAGTLLAAGAAQIVSPVGHAAAARPPKQAVPPAPFGAPPVGAGPLFAEVDDDHGEDLSDPGGRDRQPQRGTRAAVGMPTDLPRHDRGRASAIRDRDADIAPAAAGRSDFSRAVEPVSAQWGRGNGQRRRAAVRALGPNDYVWDMMAEREVRMGEAFADTLGLSGGRTASPDVLRDMIAPESLPDFDDAILGGGEPSAGRFDVELYTVNGDAIRLEGRRQVDHEGLLVRLEARLSELATAAPARPSFAAPPRQSAAALAHRPAPVPTAPVRAAPRGSMGGGDSAVAALERGDIAPVLSPVVRLADRQLVGHDARAAIDTGRGAPLADGDLAGDLAAAGHAADLAEILLPEAARELAQWVAAEPDQGQFVLADCAPGALTGRDATRIVRAAIDQTGAPAGALVVTFDEARIKADPQRALGVAKALRAGGASLALDGHGATGTALSKFSKFAFDMVKLDPRLVAGATAGKKQRAALKSILAAASKAGIPVVAAGVEDEETASLLDRMGCAFATGPLFGPPSRPQRGGRYGGGGGRGGYEPSGYGAGDFGERDLGAANIRSRQSSDLR